MVVGGGITGLTAAFRASQQEGFSVTLLEARPDLGGKVDTVALDGARVELSADAFLPRDDVPLRLCRDIGIAAELVEPSDFGGWVFGSGGLTPLPAGTVLGFPTSPGIALRAKPLSIAGRLRAASEIFNRRPLSGPDVSVGSFTRARLGREALDRLVDPLLAGTRAGDPDEMSLAAAVPPVDAAARADRSVIRGLARRAASAHEPPRFLAPRDGMHRIVEALEGAISDVDVRREVRVGSIHHAGQSLTIDLDGDVLGADAAIVTAPAHEAASLLRPLSEDAAAELSGIRAASSAVVNLIFPAGAVRLPPSGSGVLVPRSEATSISGCTWFSKKWPEAAASDGRLTIRCFVGRGIRDPALDLSDRDLVGVVIEELRAMLGFEGGAIASKVTRWDQGMPVYAVGHLERIARIEAALARHPVRLAGASYRGSGIPDCIAQAEAAVRGIVEALRR